VKAIKHGALQRRVPNTRSITIRLAVRDVEAAQALAKREGLPYQTYIKLLLHLDLEQERIAG